MCWNTKHTQNKKIDMTEEIKNTKKEEVKVKMTYLISGADVQ